MASASHPVSDVVFLCRVRWVGSGRRVRMRHVPGGTGCGTVRCNDVLAGMLVMAGPGPGGCVLSVTLCAHDREGHATSVCKKH
jgi:hypothetical protein